MNLEDFKIIKKDNGMASIKFLERNVPFKEKLIGLIPHLESDIESASKNQSCSCKSSILTYIENNKDSYLKFLYDFLVLDGSFGDYIEILNDHIIYTDFSGRVVKTSIKEWKGFQKQLLLENATFNFFSVVKDGDDLLVFFL
jgi:hypothetical protein